MVFSGVIESVVNAAAVELLMCSVVEALSVAETVLCGEVDKSDVVGVSSKVLGDSVVEKVGTTVEEEIISLLAASVKDVVVSGMGCWETVVDADNSVGTGEIVDGIVVSPTVLVLD